MQNQPQLESHKRILGILYIVSGIMHLIGMILLSMLFSFFLPLIFEHADVDDQWVLVWVVPFIRAIASIVIILIAIPSLLGGWGLLTQKTWSMTLVLIIGCLKLFSFPFGTAIGIYTIWVYAEEHRLKQINQTT
jgi:cation transport ATPase